MTNSSSGGSSGRRVCNHRTKYLRSPMYLSLQGLEHRSHSMISPPQLSEKNKNDETFSQVTPRGNKSASGFLPDIKPSPYKVSTQQANTDKSFSSKLLSLSFPVPGGKEKSLCEYWSGLKSMYLAPKHILPISCSCDQHMKQSNSQNKFGSQSAPVITTKTFEETLLPTHNIFFAGRPPSPKRPIVVKPPRKAREIIDTDPIIIPLRRSSARKTTSVRNGRRVKFLDQNTEKSLPKPVVKHKRTPRVAV